MCVQSQLVNLRSIMERFHPAFFVVISSTLEALQSEPRHGLISANVKATGIKAFAPYLEDFAALGMKASAASLKRILDLYSKEDSTFEKLDKLADELYHRIVDEIEGELFLSLTQSEAARYERWWNGWEAVLARFPDTARDVEETNKCFALSRYTAAMFHALHVAEWGAIQLGDYIGVTDPKKGWGPTEKKLRELIKGGHSNLPASLTGVFEFLEQMNREIDSMVLAWRHKVDHAANHLAIVPNTDFTPDIAEHVIGAVRVFMQRLIEGIPVGPLDAV
jgi:hypothetical protein